MDCQAVAPRGPSCEIAKTKSRFDRFCSGARFAEGSLDISRSASPTVAAASIAAHHRQQGAGAAWPGACDERQAFPSRSGASGPHGLKEALSRESSAESTLPCCIDPPSSTPPGRATLLSDQTLPPKHGVMDARTRARCLVCLQAGPRAPGMEAFNVNASHHGGIVGCASCNHA